MCCLRFAHSSEYKPHKGRILLVPCCVTAHHTHQTGAKPSVRMMQAREWPWLVQSYAVANQSEALTQAEDSWVLIYMFSLPDSGKMWADDLIPPTSMVYVALDTALPSVPQFSQQQDGYVIRQRLNALPLGKNRARFHLPQELTISFNSLSTSPSPSDPPLLHSTKGSMRLSMSLMLAQVPLTPVKLK